MGGTSTAHDDEALGEDDEPVQSSLF
jgi:hypothetical protein